jgi:preprotein translocase SecE subunit
MVNPLQTGLRFAQEAYREVQKVTFLPRKQMTASTLLVIVLVLIVSFYVSLVDLIVSQVFGIFIRI